MGQKPSRLPACAGYTLIELLTILTIIAILVIVIMGRIHESARLARESVLRENLRELRTAISTFETTVGRPPIALADLVATTRGALHAGYTAHEIARYPGPFLTPSGGIPVQGSRGVPRNPFAPAASTNLAEHWAYDAETGRLTVPESMRDEVCVETQESFGSL